MFALSERDLERRILGCADGPASFNAELTSSGGDVVSCDPLYRFEIAEIRVRIDLTCNVMIERARAVAHRFVWKEIESPEALGRVRMRAMNRFLEDYEIGKEQARYRVASLPTLGFADDAFGLALCSHFLFLYSDEFGLEFHCAAILELCRVASEVRVFPLLDMRGEPSSHVRPVTETLRGRGMHVAVEEVDYEFQVGGNQMMRVW
jgi:hypothetical protein